MEDMTLAQLNWGLAIADLDDAIKYLHDCNERLRDALVNVAELRGTEKDEQNV